MLGFEVCDEHGQPIGRFEGYVTLMDVTPEQFCATATAT